MTDVRKVVGVKVAYLPSKRIIGEERTCCDQHSPSTSPPPQHYVKILGLGIEK